MKDPRSVMHMFLLLYTSNYVVSVIITSWFGTKDKKGPCVDLPLSDSLPIQPVPMYRSFQRLVLSVNTISF